MRAGRAERPERTTRGPPAWTGRHGSSAALACRNGRADAL